MNRRTFLSTLGTSLVALNLTLGFRPSAVKAEPIAPVPVEEEYRLVAPLKALEDINVGDIVVRYFGNEDGVRKAQHLDHWYGIAESKGSKGQMVNVCVRGFTSVRYIRA